MARIRRPRFIEVQILPDPGYIAEAYYRAAKELENDRDALRLASEIARQDTIDHFNKQEAPDGDPWADWSLSYKLMFPSMQPPHPGLKKLQWRGDLKRAATSKAAFVVRKGRLHYSTAGLPRYWNLHQYGNLSAAARERAGKAVSEIRAAGGLRFAEVGRATQLQLGRRRSTEGEIAQFAREDKRIAQDRVIPARPFIGLSLDAQRAIAGAYGDIVLKKLAPIRTPTGRIGFRHTRRGAGGQFVPRPLPEILR
jgi:phage gpG-like protein